VDRFVCSEASLSLDIPSDCAGCPELNIRWGFNKPGSHCRTKIIVVGRITGLAVSVMAEEPKIIGGL